MISSMDRGKNTEPKYAIRFAFNAISRLCDTANNEYPKFTINTDENSIINQNLF